MRQGKYGVFSLRLWRLTGSCCPKTRQSKDAFAPDSPGLGHSLSYGDIWAGSVKGLLRSHPAIAAFCLSTMVFGMRVIREDAPHGPAPHRRMVRRRAQALGSVVLSGAAAALCGVCGQPSLLQALPPQTAFLPQSGPKLILFPGHDPSVSDGIQPFNH